MEVTREEPITRPVEPPIPEAAAPASPRVGGLAARWSALPWVVRPVVIYLCSRLLVWFAFLVAEVFSHRDLAQEIIRWDSRWFVLAAGHGWPAHQPYPQWPHAQSTVAFFPLFPLSIRGVSAATGLSLLTAGTLISLLTGLTAMVAIWALARELYQPRVADRATLAVAIFPGSFVLSMIYAEGFALTFVAVGMLALLRRRWVLAGVVGALATATSPLALAFVVSALWCAVAAIRRDRDWRSLLAPVLAPLGFVAYMLALWRVTGNLTAWTDTERRGWHSSLSAAYPFRVLWHFVKWPWTSNVTNDILFVGLLVAVALVVLAVKVRLRAPLFLYGLVVVVLATASVPVGLRPRFLFLAFPLVMVIGIGLKGRWYWALMILSAGLLAGLAFYSVAFSEVFP